MIYLLIGYMWLFVHRPFEVWPILGTIHLERMYVAFCVLYWLLFHPDKRWVSNRFNLAFGLLWVAITLSYLASPYIDSEQCNATIQNYLKVFIFYPLVITTVRDERQLRLLTLGFLAGFAIYMSHSLREFRNGRYVFRMGIVRMVGVGETASDPNSFASSIVYALTIALAHWPEAKGRKMRAFMAYYTGLSVLCVLLTGSRSGMVGLVCVSLFSLRRLLRRKILLLLLLGAAPLGWGLMDERLQNRFWTLIDPSVGPKNAEQSAEGRWQGMIDGLTLWQERPAFGFGPGAHGLAMGHGYQAHNVYGQVAGETGTLGAAAFLMLVTCFLLNGWEARGLRKRLAPEVGRFLGNLCTSVLIALVLLLIKGYSDHNMYRYNWVWFAAFQVITLGCLRDYCSGRAVPPTSEGTEPLTDQVEAPAISDSPR